MLNFHPHLHVMATDGGIAPDGQLPDANSRDGTLISLLATLG